MEDLAPSIHFENAPVKYKTEKTLYVRNIGRKVANFTLEAARVPSDLCVLFLLPLPMIVNVRIQSSSTRKSADVLLCALCLS